MKNRGPSPLAWLFSTYPSLSPLLARCSFYTATGAKRLRDGIHSPSDIKSWSEQELPQLAQEVRDELIRVLSQTGGDLGPKLGVVELTISFFQAEDGIRDLTVTGVQTCALPI